MKVQLEHGGGYRPSAAIEAHISFPFSLTLLLAIAAEEPGLTIDDAQFGAKVGKHAQDFGLNPADPYRMVTQAELDAELPWKFTTPNNGIGIILRGVGYFSWFGQ